MDKTEAVTISRGQVLTRTLKGKGSAGYSWTYELSGDESAVTVAIGGTGNPTAPGGSPSSSSADEQVLVRGVSPGVVTINLFLRRPWERNKTPLAKQALKVTVRD